MQERIGSRILNGIEGVARSRILNGDEEG